MSTTSLLLPDIAVTDWLSKLGELAFSSWLRLRIWKQRGELKISTRELIKKLNVSNHTFYTKILAPLWEHGLIDMLLAEGKKLCKYPQVYDAPMNLPEKALLPLERVRRYSPSVSCCFTECNVTPNETFPSVNVSKPDTVSLSETTQDSPVAKNETLHVQEHSPSYLYDLKEKEKERKEMNDSIDPSSLSSSFSSLSQELQNEIHKHTQLSNHIAGISELYEVFQTHPHFSLPIFLEKMTLCLERVNNPSAYMNYFRKTLANLWSSNSSQPVSPRMKPHPPAPAVSLASHGLPEWIVRQEERKHAPVQQEPQQLNPEQQAEINRLLKEHGECPA